MEHFKDMWLPLYVYVILFFLQLSAVLIGEYLLSLFKETGKLEAHKVKEWEDLKRDERRDIGNQILEFIFKPFEDLSREDVLAMYKSSSRIGTYKPELADKWGEYFAASFVKDMDEGKGYNKRDPDNYQKNVKKLKELRTYLEQDANRLIGELS